MKIVTLWYDSDIQNPAEFDSAWTLYSFSRRHTSFKDPSEFFPDGKPSIGLRRKLEVGTAFLLSYYEHGNSVWSLRGTGPKCQFDSVDVAGILLCKEPKNMGAKTLEARRTDAGYFVDIYTAWCNGDGYGYQIEEEVTLPCGHKEIKDVDSCYGFYGTEVAHMAQQVKSVVGNDEIVVRGEAAMLAKFHDFGRVVEAT